MKKIYLFIAISFFLGAQSLFAQQSNEIIINADQAEYEISEHIYGHFAEHLGRGIYGGIWVGEDSDIPNKEGYRTDVLEALKKLEIPNIRWPGGCFADEYDWRDGIGPRDERPDRVNTHWGMVTEPNTFGTHEFLRLTELLDAEPYISANVGSGTPKEMQEWLEYMTYPGDSKLADMRRENGREEPWDIKFFGIGNESWGCGGSMRPEYYADLYRRYSTFAKHFGDGDLYKIASGWSDDRYNWTDVVMDRAGFAMDAISLHYYTIAGPNWGNKGSSTDFGEDMYFEGIKAALQLDEYVTRHSKIMDQYDPEKRVALAVDEWGIWTDPLPNTNPGFLEQQNSLRDALIASSSLDILNSHADRVRIANIAQMVNVLQAMILTEDEKMVKTPTYYVFEMYKVHQNSELLPMHVEAAEYTHNDESVPAISSSASRDDEGRVHITISNLDAGQAQDVEIDLRGADVEEVSNGRILTAEKVNSYNTFDNPDAVTPAGFEDYEFDGGNLSMKLPSKSVVLLTLE